MTEVSTPTTNQPLVVNPTKPPSGSPKPALALTISQISPQSMQPRKFVCDKNYYHESGDLSFVVEDTVFKIHRFQLDRSLGVKPLPLGEQRQQLLLKETMAENKIFLPDNVDEFRALCWALYAPPQETALQYNASNFKLKLILDLFSISHRYCLESLQTFATQLLVHHSTPPNTTCRAPELEYILRLAIRNDVFPLTKVVEQALLRRLQDADQTISTARLITLAEELGMRKFQGMLYYHELVKEEASFIFKIPLSTAYEFPCTNLTEKQSLALFRGYRSLLRYWHQLPGAVRGKKVSQLASCKDHHHKCQNEWDSVWSVETIKNRDPFPFNFDILASLEKVQTSRPDTLNPIPFSFTPNSQTSATSASNAFVTATPLVFPPNTQSLMRQCGQKELSDLIKQLKDTLADHFLGSQLP